MTRSLFSRIVLVLSLMCLVLLPIGVVNGQTPAASIGVFDPLVVAPDKVVEIPIRVENVQALYAIDFEMTFDPAIASAQDADPGNPGVQMGFGIFLDPGLFLFNTIDNAQGKVRFVMTQTNPSTPKSGSGILFVLYLKGIKEGETNLKITNLQISDRQGIEIPSRKMETTLSVRKDAAVVNPTPIPVVNPTLIVMLPTAAATAIPTAAPTVIATKIPTVIPTALATALPTLLPKGTVFVPTNTQTVAKSTAIASPVVVEPTKGIATKVPESASGDKESGFSPIGDWWVVVLVVALAVYLGFRVKRTIGK